MILTPGNDTSPVQGEVVTESTHGFAATRIGLAFEIDDDSDIAECALDEQLEQLQRQYAAASRASSKARFELELLEKRDDIPAHVIAQAKRQRAAAETRSARLLRAIDALEDRLENE
jgi:septal ring factor EnvC (AmiA/AmiB activator)